MGPEITFSLTPRITTFVDLCDGVTEVVRERASDGHAAGLVGVEHPNAEQNGIGIDGGAQASGNLFQGEVEVGIGEDDLSDSLALDHSDVGVDPSLGELVLLERGRATAGLYVAENVVLTSYTGVVRADST